MARHLTIRPVYDILKGERRQHGEDLEQGEGGTRRQEALWCEQEVKGYVVTSGNEGEEYAWPSFDDIHEISLAAVDNHQGYRDPGLVEGAVGNTQMQQMYGQHEDVFDTAANLITKIQRQQAIVEGNKRTATNVGLAFLANNGYDISPVVDSEQKEDELVRLIMEISTNDDAIGELAQFLRENSVMEKTATMFPEGGGGVAFWYDPHSGGLHWGPTHYKIFEGLYKPGNDLQHVYDQQQLEQGIFGWVFPDSSEEGGYAIDFASDFGYGSNKKNLHELVDEATDAVEQQMGYQADEVTMGYPEFSQPRSAGHAYETDDLSGDGLITCQNCGSQIAGDLCGNCGSANLQWWTEGEGLQHFKGSLQKKSVTVEGVNYSCFAFLPPMLYLGNRHHMAIMNQLLQHGWTWETLMAAKQLWGWASDGDVYGDNTHDTIGLYLQTDAAILDKSLLPQLEMALTKLTGKSNFVLKSDQEPTNEEYAPDWDSHYGDDGFYNEVPPVLAYNSETGATEHWGTADVGFENKAGAWQEDTAFEELILLDNSWSVGYNTRTSSTWEEQFESPVDEDLGEFEQEEEGLSEEQKKEQGIEGPFEIDGWTVWTRDCDDAYPTHDAIIIDRAKRIMIIGYQGHHADIAANSPFMQNLMMGMSPYDQTAGHFRTEPSKTEPHPTGFLWHGFDANKEEKNVLKQVLRQHYNVDNLKSLYKDIPDAYQEEEYPYYEEDEEY